MPILLKILAGILIAYLVAVTVLFLYQRRLIYLPDTTRVEPAAMGLGQADVVTVTTSDGLALTGWWLGAADDRPVLLYFQGNGGSIAGRAEKAATLHANGYSVLLAGYRGYGGNPGSPSEEGLLIDAQAWLDHLVARGVQPGRIVLYGESLGSGVAVALVAARSQETRLGGMVLEAPFTSIRALAQAQYPLVPVRWLLLDPFDSLARIPLVRLPLLIIHGDRDRLVPLAHAERLIQAANAPKVLRVIVGADHNSLVESGALQEVDAFLTEHEVAIR